VDDFPEKNLYLQKLIHPSYSENYTGAQFLTEVQGGSDVGLNATEARLDDDGKWRILGEKWFCSNADAELILLTARVDTSKPGTKGLGLFLVPATLEKR
jgi:alkylation response protein AidB-like acyl-CoA dehydrogenase